MAKIAIIGGGVIGSSIAYYLALAGHTGDVSVLPDFPPTSTPVSLLYPPNRQLSPRVRVFIERLVHAFDASRG